MEMTYRTKGICDVFGRVVILVIMEMMYRILAKNNREVKVVILVIMEMTYRRVPSIRNSVASCNPCYNGNDLQDACL